MTPLPKLLCSMKLLFIILFSLTQLSSQAQITGRYDNSFGSRITLNADSTFRYRWNFDLASSWNTGNWSVKNDTIYLISILVYDTLKIKDDKGGFRDSLVYSLNEKSESITNEEYVPNQLVSGGQGRKAILLKLFYYGDRLFEFSKELKPLKKRVRGFMTSRKVVPWYRKL